MVLADAAVDKEWASKVGFGFGSPVRGKKAPQFVRSCHGAARYVLDHVSCPRGTGCGRGEYPERVRGCVGGVVTWLCVGCTCSCMTSSTQVLARVLVCWNAVTRRKPASKRVKHNPNCARRKPRYQRGQHVTVTSARCVRAAVRAGGNNWATVVTKRLFQNEERQKIHLLITVY